MMKNVMEDKAYELRRDVLEYMIDDELALAIRCLHTFLPIDNDWILRDELSEIEQLYKQMLAYEMKGVEDPRRDILLDKLKSDLILLSESAAESYNLREKRGFLYDQKRSINNAYVLSDAVLNLFAEQTTKIQSYSQEFHKELDTYFKYFAFASYIEKDNLQRVRMLLDENDVPVIVKEMTVSALVLNILSAYSSDILALLLAYVECDDAKVKARVHVGVMLIIAEYNDRIIYDKHNYDVLSVLLENDILVQDIEYVYTEIVRTYENKRISKKLQEEILPEMLKLQSKDIFKVGMNDDDDDDDMFNPNWQEEIENSSLGEKLREFGDLQLAGADVFATTFAPMKNYSFFNTLSNWFMPFDEKNIALAELFQGEDGAMSVLSKSTLCNSDKYSFFLTIATMPQEKVAMMVSSISEQVDQMKEDMGTEQWKNDILDYKQSVRQYVQDLYRFYTLYMNKSDFVNPMTIALYLFSSEIYDLVFKTTEQRLRNAEFLFEKDCYDESGLMFLKLEGQMMHGAEDYQKMGYAFSKTGKHILAVNTYEKALNLLPNDEWTIKALARNYKIIGDKVKEQFYIEKLYELKPDDEKVISQLSKSYYNNGEYDKALKLLYKLDYMMPNNMMTFRKLFVVLLLQKDVEKALFYLDLMLVNPEELDANDWIHIFYFYIFKGEKDSALNAMMKAFCLYDGDVNDFYMFCIKEDLIYGLNINETGFRLYCETVIMNANK